jgi:hypothetical protein
MRLPEATIVAVWFNRFRGIAEWWDERDPRTGQSNRARWYLEYYPHVIRERINEMLDAMVEEIGNMLRRPVRVPLGER